MEKTRVIVSNIYLLDEATKEETRLHAEMVFGRTDGHKNYPQDAAISRKHFRVMPADDVVLIEDLGSTNKTKVNGKVLKPSTLYKLRSRDIIEFGKQKLQIFIGGQIVAEKDEAKAADTNADPSSALVLDRFCTTEDVEQGAGVTSASALEVNKAGDSPDSVMMIDLDNKKNCAWYLQFEGSEFGPLTFKEMKAILKSDQFKGGALFAFTEGLSNWTPVSALAKILSEPGEEFTGTQRLDHSVPLVATVTCYLDKDKKKKVSAACDDINLSEINIACKEAIKPEGTQFEIEVFPLAASGIDKFRATVKLSDSQPRRGYYCLVLLATPPKAKMQIEKYIKARS